MTVEVDFYVKKNNIFKQLFIFLKNRVKNKSGQTDPLLGRMDSGLIDPWQACN